MHINGFLFLNLKQQKSSKKALKNKQKTNQDFSNNVHLISYSINNMLTDFRLRAFPKRCIYHMKTAYKLLKYVYNYLANYFLYGFNSF